MRPPVGIAFELSQDGAAAGIDLFQLILRQARSARLVQRLKYLELAKVWKAFRFSIDDRRLPEFTYLHSRAVFRARTCRIGHGRPVRRHTR